MLRHTFATVTRHDLTGTLRLPHTRPAVDYVRSLGIDDCLADKELLAAAVARRLDFSARGFFAVTTHCGWLICA